MCKDLAWPDLGTGLPAVELTCPRPSSCPKNLKHPSEASHSSWFKPGPWKEGSALFQQVAQIKTPQLKRQLKIQSCPKRREGGGISPSHTVCFLDSLASKSRAERAPGGAPPLFLVLPVPFMQKGVLRHRGQRSGQTRIRPAHP